MIKLLKRELKTVVIVVATAALTAGAPAIAHGVHAAFAHNADKVDNKHAVGAGATLTKARGKLVTTGTSGKFASKFIPKVGAAVNADKLGNVAAAGYARDLGHLVTVATSGGDFTSVQAAIDSITDASQANPYTVFVGPGVFEGRVVLKSGVSLLGVGIESVIRAPGITGDPANRAVLVGANGSSVRHLSIESPGPNAPLGVYNNVGGFRLDNVQIFVQESTTTAGIAVFLDGGNAIIKDSSIVSFSFSAPLNSYGILVSGAFLELWGSKVLAVAQGPETATAVSVGDTGNQVSIRGSQLVADDHGVFNDDAGPGQIEIGYSEVTSAAGTGGFNCVGVFTEAFAALDTNCQPPAP
jgi:hypothetical protein